MNIDLREELRKRDELLDGYLKQIEIQKEFIQIKSSSFFVLVPEIPSSA